MAFIKFYFGSLLTNLVGYFIFISFAFWGVSINISLAFAYAISFVISQLINYFVVFNGAASKFRSLLINFLMYIALYTFNVEIIEFGSSRYQINPFGSQFIAMFFLIIVNYFFQRHIYLFKSSKIH